MLNLRVTEIGQAVHWGSVSEWSAIWNWSITRLSTILQPLQRQNAVWSCFFSMTIFSFTHWIHVFRRVQLSVFCWVRNGSSQCLINDLSSLIFMVQSHADEAKPKTSPQISCTQITLKVLIWGHNQSSQWCPASLVIAALHHWASAKQVSGRSIGRGRGFCSWSSRADPSAANWQAVSTALVPRINPH